MKTFLSQVMSGAAALLCAGAAHATDVTSFTHYSVSDADYSLNALVGGTGTLTSGNVVDLYINAFYCADPSDCAAHTLFTSNKGQLAIDNIAVNSDVIDFEPNDTDTSGAPLAPLLLDGDYVVPGDYFVQALDSTYYGTSGSLVGQLSNGSDPTTCIDNTCPAGDSTSFLSVYNNGLIYLQQLSGDPFTLSGFDAAFLPPAGVTLPSGTVALLAVEANRDDHTFAFGVFGLNGPSAPVPVVPEPAEWMLMALGLGAVGRVVRRRQAA